MWFLLNSPTHRCCFLFYLVFVNSVCKTEREQLSRRKTTTKFNLPNACIYDKSIYIRRMYFCSVWLWVFLFSFLLPIFCSFIYFIFVSLFVRFCVCVFVDTCRFYDIIMEHWPEICLWRFLCGERTKQKIWDMEWMIKIEKKRNKNCVLRQNDEQIANEWMRNWVTLMWS